MAYDLVDHVLLAGLVVQDDPDDRDEHDRQRDEREEHPVRDARRMLRQPVAEVAVDRHGHGADEVLDDSERPPRQVPARRRLLGGARLGHPR
jgi:hypothetical protein